SEARISAAATWAPSWRRMAITVTPSRPLQCRLVASVPDAGGEMRGRRPVLRTPQHGAQDFFHLRRLERLGDQSSGPVFNWNCRLRVAGEKDERNAPRRQDRTDRKTRPAVEVDVQDCAVERALTGHLHGAFQPADRAR